MRGCTQPNFMFSVYFSSYVLSRSLRFASLTKLFYGDILFVRMCLRRGKGVPQEDISFFLFCVRQWRTKTRTWSSMLFRKTETVCLWWLGNAEMPRNDFECKISLHLMEGTLTLGSSAFTLGLWTDVSSWCYDVNLLKLSVTKGTEINCGRS